jgi:hypothetical protein
MLPVGRRLAFDPSKGRLWVICPRCRGWNLVPLLERWEALEEAERRFEIATIGTSTENIALGHLGDGTELIRVGRTRRGELAAWRYANRLVARGMKSGVVGGLVIVGAYAVGLGAGLNLLGVVVGVGLGAGTILGLRDRRPILRTRDGRTIRAGDGARARLRPGDGELGWRLIVPRLRSDVELDGDEGLRVLRKLVPRANPWGGSPAQVEEALSDVERVGSPSGLVRMVASELGHTWNVDPAHNPLAFGALGPASPHRIVTGRPRLRLALEMAVNEEIERRALAGEMHLLEREWREAEELAGVSDDLLLPDSVRAWLDEHRTSRDGSS